jgi:hypothetical protein
MWKARGFAGTFWCFFQVQEHLVEFGSTADRGGFNVGEFLCNRKASAQGVNRAELSARLSNSPALDAWLFSGWN